MFKVYDDYANDTRVSINSSSFSNMWWGPPHLPNSGLVKEIITNGFTNPLNSFTSDCLRQHVHRSDSVADHMAYNVDASFTPNSPVYASFWAKSVDENAVGKSINFYHYTYGVQSATDYSTSAVLGPVGAWKRYGYTFTSPNNTAISYWFNPGGPYKYDIANIQFEQKDHATPFVEGTRSATQGLLPLIGNSTIDLTNVSFDSNAQITFDGTNDYVKIPDSTAMQVGDVFTINAWVFPTNLNARYGVFSTRRSNSSGCWQLEVGTASGGTNRVAVTGIGTWIFETANNVISPNVWSNICFVKPGNGVQGGTLYINGNLISPATTTAYNISNNLDDKVVGSGTNLSQFFPGDIANILLYNRALTATEAQQNYNKYKTRFNLS